MCGTISAKETNHRNIRSFNDIKTSSQPLKRLVLRLSLPELLWRIGEILHEACLEDLYDPCCEAVLKISFDDGHTDSVPMEFDRRKFSLREHEDKRKCDLWLIK